MNTNKSELISLIENLNENQITFVLSMLKELFSVPCTQDTPSAE